MHTLPRSSDLQCFKLSQTTDSIFIAIPIELRNVETLDCHLFCDRFIIAYKNWSVRLIFRNGMLMLSKSASTSKISEKEIQISLRKKSRKAYEISVAKSDNTLLYAIRQSSIMTCGFLNSFAYDDAQKITSRDRVHYIYQYFCDFQSESRIFSDILAENNQSFDIEHYLLDSSNIEGTHQELKKSIYEYANSGTFSYGINLDTAELPTEAALENMLDDEMILSWRDSSDVIRSLLSGITTKSQKISTDEIRRVTPLCNRKTLGASSVDEYKMKAHMLTLWTIKRAVDENRPIFVNFDENKLPLSIFLSTLCSLTDIMLALIYDDLITCGECNTESAWTVENMSASMRHNAKFLDESMPPTAIMTSLFDAERLFYIKKNVDKVVHTSAKRCVSANMLRSIKIFFLTLRAAVNISKAPDDAIVKLFVRGINLIEYDAQRAHLSTLYLKPLLVWILRHAHDDIVILHHTLERSLRNLKCSPLEIPQATPKFLR